jgi:putative transposase
MRKEALVTGQVYHIFSKSIAGFKIFNNEEDYSRYILSMRYYMRERTGVSFCNALKEPEVKKGGVDILVQIIAYSTMPTHIHFALKQLKDKGITTFMRRFLDSYTRYFNIKHNRKGPLWEGKFKNVLVSSDEQLLHLSRYIHLNPVAALLVDKPEEWGASSYKADLRL